MVVTGHGSRVWCETNFAAKVASDPLHKPAVETGLILNSDELEMFYTK